MTVDINKQSLQSFLIFNKEIPYNKFITLYPIHMKDYLSFQQFQLALTLRKDSIFRKKEFIKMGYLEFIQYACRNMSLAEEYKLTFLPFYYDFIIGILQLACGEEAKIKYSPTTLEITINDFVITNSVFDDLRRIIIIQNDIDFDIDEFMNIDTVHALEKAREFEAKKKKETANIEDYIDSLIVSLKMTEEYVSNLTIRKFWRYIKRINKHEEYIACRSGQMSGMVTFKEPLQHWMTSMEVLDKDENFKTDESEVRNKVLG